jgi:hypothetical protein
MSNVKISEMLPAQSVAGSEKVPVIKDGSNVSVTIDEIRGVGEGVNSTVQTALDLKANLAGPTFSGNPQSNAAPVSGDHLTNKTYVDASSTDGFTPESYAGEESVTFPNGLIMKWGVINMAGDTTATVTFAQAFSTIKNVQVSKSRNTNSSTNTPTIKSISNSNFVIRNPSDHTHNMYWQAIGF